MANSIVKEYPSPSAGVSYLKYVALLYQIYVSSTSGLLVIGKTYQIDTLVAGDDFANVGYVASSTPFIATGTTPTVWTNSTEVINITDSAPIATVLENTLGEIITWTYVSPGYYVGTTPIGIDLNKSTVSLANTGTDKEAIYQANIAGNGEIRLYTFSYNGTDSAADRDGWINRTPIEIRVYP